MKRTICGLLTVLFLAGNPVSSAWADSGEKFKPSCDTSVTTVCTIEIWLGHKQKKNNKEIRGFLKSKKIKVLRHTIQYWKPRGGHPPTNLAIGSAVSAEDGRMVIELALKYNDEVNGLIYRMLNPPNYVAIATSAWDDLSETPITKEELEALRDPKLTTEEFHALYYKLTDEGSVQNKFY